MKNLLDAGVDINAQDDDGFTAAHYAAHRWDVNPDSIEPDTLELLLQYKANISIKANNGMTPLHLATSAKAVQLLLDAGADISAITNNGKTPLCTAKEVGTIYAVNALIARGAGLGVRSLEID
jgi:ankyrin repeat protein